MEEYEIVFTHHVIERMMTRNDWLNNYKNYKELKADKENIATKMKRTGVWYTDEDWTTKQKTVRFYCVLNTLSVFCGVLDTSEETRKIILTTFYPYTQKMKRKWAGWDRFFFGA